MAKKPDWFYRQSAVIPVLGDKVVLITSLCRKRWIIPKGIVEPGMTPEDSAIKEALEEAGVAGALNAADLGTYEYQKWGGVCKVQVFELRVESLLEQWEEMDLRDRRLVSPSEAVELVDEEGLKEIFRRRFSLDVPTSRQK